VTLSCSPASVLRHRRSLAIRGPDTYPGCRDPDQGVVGGYVALSFSSAAAANDRLEMKPSLRSSNDRSLLIRAISIWIGSARVALPGRRTKHRLPAPVRMGLSHSTTHGRRLQAARKA